MSNQCGHFPHFFVILMNKEVRLSILLIKLRHSIIYALPKNHLKMNLIEMDILHSGMNGNVGENSKKVVSCVIVGRSNRISSL